MMDGSIICGVDGSVESRAALHVAVGLSGRLGVPLVVAHVSPAAIFAPAAGSTPVVTKPTAEELQAGEELLEQLAADEGLAEASLRSLHGLPAERLADLADEEDAAFVASARAAAGPSKRRSSGASPAI
jgi:nucleotide-binding universal stress UspA family protein